MAAPRRGRLPGGVGADRGRRGSERRLTIAIPSKGRLFEPTWALLCAAGLDPEEPGAGSRALSVRCRSAAVELVFVRAHDIVEYVADGVVDGGITGLDLVRERDSSAGVLLRLGFGACALVVAVPREDPATCLADLAGRRLATSHPHLAARGLADAGVDATPVSVTGSVEIAPRLGLADAIVDLVSSGSTLRANGLRPLATLDRFEAVLIGPDGERSSKLESLITMLGSVAAARGARYLMCNAPAAAVPEIAALMPTRGAPSVIPLTTPDRVALHALVGTAEIWHVLPALRELGASSILVLPVERMVP